MSGKHTNECGTDRLSQSNCNHMGNAHARDPLYSLYIIQYHTEHRNPVWDIHVKKQGSQYELTTHFEKNKDNLLQQFHQTSWSTP